MTSGRTAPPSIVTTALVVTVTAAWSGDSTRTGSAQVTVNPAPASVPVQPQSSSGGGGGAFGFVETYLAERFANSKQPLVPERVFITGGSEGSDGHVSIAQTLLGLLVSEKSGMNIAEVTPVGAAADAKKSPNA